jgi:hypothetical protein
VGTLTVVDEKDYIEVERALLYVGEARDRAARSADALAKGGAGDHLVEALREAEQQLSEIHTQLMQRTYFAVTDAQFSI